jgi:hypothetical protein
VNDLTLDEAAEGAARAWLEDHTRRVSAEARSPELEELLRTTFAYAWKEGHQYAVIMADLAREERVVAAQRQRARSARKKR